MLLSFPFPMSLHVSMLLAFFCAKDLQHYLQKSQATPPTRSPLLTLRCYTQEMEACLKAGHAEAHFIEEVKQYFALDQPKKASNISSSRPRTTMI
ncbi:unnamed protein product [Brassica napus]|uniref:(rape) hypothetical protein n=1 Tax=Brassica napus TaxID=3708 RepID=A0A816P0T1_BRANA|nr:unnamed protein product [Brassica napus]